MDLVKTHRGLPNSCSICGKRITTEFWFALNEQAAIAGQGGHRTCLEGQNEPESEDEE